jgi:hypothetical protein
MQAESRYNPNGPTCISHNSIMLATTLLNLTVRFSKHFALFYASRFI